MDRPNTTETWYTERLRNGPRAFWKRMIPNPYRWNLRRLGVGRMLDVGCGVGRCLGFIDGGGVGIDHNPSSVQECRNRGFEAYTPDEFAAVDLGLFDTLLLSHVLEHLDADDGEALVAQYLEHLRPGGRVVIVTPQEAGQNSDPTHVRFVDSDDSRGLLERLGASSIRSRSFPFPRRFGRLFLHNETVVVGVYTGPPEGAD